MARPGMRTVWDAAAASEEVERYVGARATGRSELESLFGRLGADPRKGTCVEVGCGFGRMTAALAERFDRVLALDVSPAMLGAARAAVSAPNVEFLAISGERLDGVENGAADTLVSYLVLQHLPARRTILGQLAEFGRVLAPGGEAFVQLPVLGSGVRPRLWRLVRAAAVPLVSRLSRRLTSRPEYRGYRLTEAELAGGLARAGLRAAARDEAEPSPYRFSREVFLRLERA